MPPCTPWPPGWCTPRSGRSRRRARRRPGRLHDLDQVLERARAAAGDDRHVHGLGHRPGELQVVAVLGAVPVHGGEQDLAGSAAPPPRAAHSTASRPVGTAPSVEVGLPARGLIRRRDRARPTGPGVGLRHRPRHRLASMATTTHCEPKRRAQTAISSGSCDGRRVQRHLVGPGVQQRPHVVLAADAAADGERDEELLGAVAGQFDDGVALLVRGGDVEKDHLVGALAVVAGGQLHRVAGVADVDEVGALDHPALVDVQAGDDALEVHASPASGLRRPARPGPRPR